MQKPSCLMIRYTTWSCNITVWTVSKVQYTAVVLVRHYIDCFQSSAHHSCLATSLYALFPRFSTKLLSYNVTVWTVSKVQHTALVLQHHCMDCFQSSAHCCCLSTSLYGLFPRFSTLFLFLYVIVWTACKVQHTILVLVCHCMNCFQGSAQSSCPGTTLYGLFPRTIINALAFEHHCMDCFPGSAHCSS